MSFRFLNEGQRGSVQEFTPIDTFIDPVSKIRVSNPSNLIDTDFEYGLQPTKWETVELINNTPAFFSKSGDTTISDITGITTNSGTREVTVTTAFPHNLAVGIPIRVSGTKSVTADGSYIINATPTETTFTYLARANQEQTISIFDLYTSVITGEFFQGSQISIDDAEGIVTNSAGPISTLTVKTPTKHGFGLNTPFYFLNLNSTISQEFESQNSASLSFDPSNSATAQTFDGSNTLLQTPIDLSNSATTSTFQSIITSTNPIAASITVALSGEDWSILKTGSPLYHSVSVGGGYFQQNPRGVVFIKNIDQINQSGGTATFQVSQIPDGPAIPILANMTGFFQIANQARTFAGNNVDPETQIDLSVEVGQEFVFDGGNRGYDGDPASPPSNTSTVVGYTGTTMTVFTSQGQLDYYQGAMVRYSTTGNVAAGLQNNRTYFVTSFEPGASAGLYTMSIAEFPNESPINVSGGSGTQSFSKIGVAVDKDIIHVKNSSFEEGDMLEYTFPAEGNFVADIAKKFYFVDVAYDIHNYRLTDDIGFKPITATGGDSVTEYYQDGVLYKAHIFTSVGTSSFTVLDAGDEGQVEYLVVAGGGGGGGGNTGADGGGGGGAGGYRSSVPGETSGGLDGPLSKITVTNQAYTVVVGAGGNGGAINVAGSNGGNSSFHTITATGGGGGARNNTAGNSGGSGGGAGGGGAAPPAGGFAGGAGSASQGFKGGNSMVISSPWSGPGGGGASEVGRPAGQAGVNATGGKGGEGQISRITGNLTYYAGGGGGGGGNTTGGTGGRTIGGVGGLGGGGRGGDQDIASPAATVGINGTGGGGGGGRSQGGDMAGARGGSGIVVVRYPISKPQIAGITATGGSISQVQIKGITYRLHTFTNVGTSTFSVTQIEKPDLARIEYLVVAGGGAGAGGTYSGGGGGAGGFIESTATISVGDYPVIVGAGGAGNNSAGNNGGNSSLLGNAAIGGGGGGQHPGGRNNGNPGGSGGGGSQGSGQPGAGTAGQGNPGGGLFYAAGTGGGGAGAGLPIGRDVSPYTFQEEPSHGGIGRPSLITGTFTYYAGGGGGGQRNDFQIPRGLGGYGGGGNGGRQFDSIAGSASPNTGGGGGGVGGETTALRTGGNGGSGIVIIRYPISEIKFTPLSSAIQATGGEISLASSGNTVYRVHEFKNIGSSTFQVTAASSVAENNLVEYLVIAGGGGGGNQHGSGGGAGGYRSSVVGEPSGGGASAEARLSVSVGNYNVVVGAGGRGTLNREGQGFYGLRGQNSSFHTITSTGGGGGGSWAGTVRIDQATGGSGGGAWTTSSGGNNAAHPGTAGQGFAGGIGIPTSANPHVGPGGGGAGGPGEAANVSSNPRIPGLGGLGVTSSITGMPVTRASGGGGATYWAGTVNAPDPRPARPGGGGQGGITYQSQWDSRQRNGLPNTGGGGGAAGHFENYGGDGGSGIVIVRYPIGTLQQ
jgi:hypothetical protein